MSEQSKLKTMEEVLEVVERLRAEFKAETKQLHDRISKIQDLSEGNLDLIVTELKKKRRV